MSIRKLHNIINKKWIIAQEKIKSGMLEEAIREMDEVILYEFNNAEIKYSIAESRLDGILGIVTRSKWSLVIVLAFALVCAGIGYAVGATV